jgi:hypothetical protein
MGQPEVVVGVAHAGTLNKTHLLGLRDPDEEIPEAFQPSRRSDQVRGSLVFTLGSQPRLEVSRLER